MDIGCYIAYLMYFVYPMGIFNLHLKIRSQFKYPVTDIVIDGIDILFARLIFGVIISAIIIGNLIPKFSPYFKCNHS
jgi:nucleoside recognition membrane protein YjiH